MSDNIALACAKFVMWAMMDGSWEGADIDGGAAQDKAEALGLIVATIYDPEKHGKSDCCDPGDTWYEPSEKLAALLSAPLPASVAQRQQVPDSEAIARIRAGVNNTDEEMDFSDCDPVEDVKALLTAYDALAVSSTDRHGLTDQEKTDRATALADAKSRANREGK